MKKQITRNLPPIGSGKPLAISGYEDDPYFAHVEDAFNEVSNLATLVRDFCPADGVVIDVGANVGVSVIVMSDANPGIRIHAVEPVPSTFDLLRRNVERNTTGNVAAYQLAISDREGEVAFHDSGNSSANHIVNEAHIASEHFANLGSPVRSTTLDAFVRENGIAQVDFVKIDVEGFEIDVLNGMTDTIARFKPVVSMEFNTWTMIAFRNVNPRDLLTRFLELMPTVYQYTRNNTYRRIITQEDKMTFLRDNIFDHGSVDDLIGCADPQRLATLG